jgi:hypothetical protein
MRNEKAESMFSNALSSLHVSSEKSHTAAVNRNNAGNASMGGTRNHVAKKPPGSTIESHQLHLFDRSEIVRAS